MWLANVAIQCLEVELKLAEVFGPELTDLEFDGDQAGQTAVKKQKVDTEFLEAAELSKVPIDAESLTRWLARARNALSSDSGIRLGEIET